MPFEIPKWLSLSFACNNPVTVFGWRCYYRFLKVPKIPNSLEKQDHKLSLQSYTHSLVISRNKKLWDKTMNDHYWMYFLPAQAISWCPYWPYCQVGGWWWSPHHYTVLQFIALPLTLVECTNLIALLPLSTFRDFIIFKKKI